MTSVGRVPVAPVPGVQRPDRPFVGVAVGDNRATFDRGRIDFADMATFTDTGEHDGERGVMPVTCNLIHHSNDWMLWDAGLGDEVAADPAGREMAGLHFRVPRTLATQLARPGGKRLAITH